MLLILPCIIQKSRHWQFPYGSAKKVEANPARRAAARDTYMDDADKELQDFLDELEDLEDDGHIGLLNSATIDDWIERAKAIQRALTEDDID
jgi:hypothetical protein